METFYRAFLPPDVKIFGYSLKPFSFGHISILRALESPFVDCNGEATAADLILALKVCTLSFPFNEYSYSRKDRVKAWLLAKKHNTFKIFCRLFAEYMKSHQYVPEFWKMKNNQSNWSDSSAPQELSTVVHLVKNGIPHEEAWNMSIGYSSWFSATLLEQAGNPRRFCDPLELKKETVEDINEKSDEELYEMAVEENGKEWADKWLEARKANK